MLKGKCVVVGVCGGIAAYKAADVVSRLVKLNAEVHVIMTKAACEFVSPLTFRTLSQNKVSTNMFDEPSEWNVKHISYAKKADLFLIVPATANFIGKVASGLADDMLTSTVMATKASVMIAPAMNTEMYTNPIVRENIKKLKKLGYLFADPDTGGLACGDIGVGRLREPELIVNKVRWFLYPKKDFSGLKVLVTAGPTREPIDPVRFISNRSTGKMGLSLGRAAFLRGADVTMICGPIDNKIDFECEVVRVTTADEMYDKSMAIIGDMDVIISAAAVSDFSPVTVSDKKIKKGAAPLPSIDLKQNRDILKNIAEAVSENTVVVGFSMETENLIENSARKLKDKRVDFMVANDLNTKGAGFAVDTNVFSILDSNGTVSDYSIMSKDMAAHTILDAAYIKYMKKRG